MNSFIEYLVYFSVKIFGFLIRLLPIGVALWIGRLIGVLAYYFDIRHKSLAHANIKFAFSQEKSPKEIKQITKKLFHNYGQNLIELLRLPLMNRKRFDQYVKIEGQEYIKDSLDKGKGVILLAMHFGSWEVASLASGMMGTPYKVIVKPQKRFTKLDNLLNSYRRSNGSVVVERGQGIRRFVEGLRNNEIVGMVVDQGGRGGTLVPFFNRQASMSVGAIRMGLKLGVPICFAIIIRQKGPYHRFVIHKPLELINTRNVEEDIKANLRKVIEIMESYIRQHPDEYMWFYKIWKYSKEVVTLILHDGRAGHLRQSEATVKLLTQTLEERNLSVKNNAVEVKFKSDFSRRLVSLIAFIANDYILLGRLGFMRWFLTHESYEQLMTIKADFVISCGSSIAPVNYLISSDHLAKSIVIQRPGIMQIAKFHLIILPEHDRLRNGHVIPNVLYTKGSPNLIDEEFLAERAQALLNRFSHLKARTSYKIGFLLGGDTKDYRLDEKMVKMIVHTLKEVSQGLPADILVTTSRRTSLNVENLLMRELKKFERCPLLIVANRQDVPEAVGGILGLSDLVLVSGDSISMISEAASSGKKVLVFPINSWPGLHIGKHKHQKFIEMLNAQGYVLSADLRTLSQGIYNLAKNKIQTRKIDDRKVIFEALRGII